MVDDADPLEALAREDLHALALRLSAAGSAAVWGYLRVSSDKQEDNQSLGMQKQDIETYCTGKGFGKVEFVVEVASAAKPMFVVKLSGTKKEESNEEGATSPRPKLLLLISQLCEMPQSRLVVWKLDRLSRVGMESETFVTLFRRSQVHLHSTKPGENELLERGGSDDPARVLMRQMLASFAHYERSMIEMRTQAGLTFKAARGGFTGGPPPFGYNVVNRELVVDAYEADMVRYIYTLRKGHGLSYAGIAATIMARKHPEDTRRYDRQKVTRIIQSEDLYRGKYTDCFGATHPRPDLKILSDNSEDSHESIPDKP